MRKNWLVVVLLSLGACGGASPESICKRVASCAEDAGRELSDADVDSCVELYEVVEQHYEEADCGAEFESLLGCVQSAATCNEERGTLENEDDDCPEEQAAADECIGKATTSSTSSTSGS